MPQCYKICALLLVKVFSRVFYL